MSIFCRTLKNYKGTYSNLERKNNELQGLGTVFWEPILVHLQKHSGNYVFYNSSPLFHCDKGKGR